jgi:hypothetical protein
LRYRRRDNLTTQPVDEETLILDLESNNIHQLNPTASFIWNQCDGAASMDQVVKMFAANYGIDVEIAQSDVRRIIEQLSELGLIEAH